MVEESDDLYIPAVGFPKVDVIFADFVKKYDKAAVIGKLESYLQNGAFGLAGNYIRWSEQNRVAIIAIRMIVMAEYDMYYDRADDRKAEECGIKILDHYRIPHNYIPSVALAKNVLSLCWQLVKIKEVLENQGRVIDLQVAMLDAKALESAEAAFALADEKALACVPLRGGK